MAEDFISRYFIHEAADSVFHVLDLDTHKILPPRFTSREVAQGYVNEVTNWRRQEDANT